MVSTGGSTDGPTLFIVDGFGHQVRSVKAILIEIGERSCESDRLRTIDTPSDIGLGNIFNLLLPDNLALLIEHLDDGSFEPFHDSSTAIRSIPNSDPLDGLRTFQIDFPPWIGAIGNRMGNRIRFEIMSIGDAVDGSFGRSAKVGATLCGHPLFGDVLGR